MESQIPRVKFKIFVDKWKSNSLYSLDDLIGEKEKSRLMHDEMEATLQDIQNM